MPVNNGCNLTQEFQSQAVVSKIPDKNIKLNFSIIFIISTLRADFTNVQFLINNDNLQIVILKSQSGKLNDILHGNITSM